MPSKHIAKPLALAILLTVFQTSYPQAIAGSALFSNRALGVASERLDRTVEAKIQPLDTSSKARFTKKKDALIGILSAMDAALSKKDLTSVRTRAMEFRISYQELLRDIRNAPKESSGTPTADPASISVPASANADPETLPASILYYADSFEWGHASNGDTFSQTYFSSAKCSTPLNTFVQVINGKKSVVVKNNDRPNCSLHPDIVDLTKNAFSAIGKLSSGKLSGSYVALGSTPKNYYKKYLPSNLFEKLGITLEQQLPNSYLKNETLRIAGTENFGKEDTLLYLQSPSGKDISLSRKRDSNGRFEYAYPLPETGVYHLVVTSGLGFETSTYADIVVFEESAFAGKKLFASDSPSDRLPALATEYYRLSDSESVFLMRFPQKKLYTVAFAQNGKTLRYSGIGTVAVKNDALASLSPEHPVDVTVTASEISTPFSLDAYTLPSTVFSRSMGLVRWYQTEKKENVALSLEESGLSVHGILPKGANVRPEVVLTLPNGDVQKYAFDKAYIDTDGFLKRNVAFERNIALEKKGQYLVELNYDNGFAAYNGPVVYGDDILPLLPSEYDAVDKRISGSLDSVRSKSLAFVNALRAKVGKSALSLDDTLNALAQAKAYDMAENNYIGHVDSRGDKILGTAKRNGIKIATSVGENVAGGNVSADFLLVGLANSWGHRENMLGNWRKAGVGYALKNGQVYYAQVFGE